jgi:hypothetical protein
MDDFGKDSAECETLISDYRRQGVALYYRSIEDYGQQREVANCILLFIKSLCEDAGYEVERFATYVKSGQGVPAGYTLLHIGIYPEDGADSDRFGSSVYMPSEAIPDGIHRDGKDSIPVQD